MTVRNILLAAALSTAGGTAAHAQVVHFKVTGVYQGQTVIAYKETGGQATVTDRVALEFDWDTRKQLVVGPVRIQNARSEVKDLRNVERSCPPPSPKGAYEHIEVTEAKDTGAGTLELKGIRSYPDIEVTAYCQGSWAKKTVRARQEPVVEHVGLLTEGVESFSVKAGDWNWTYTSSAPPKGK